jgi:ribosomal protein S18 acetylase RimI-like enzyme
MPKTITIEPLTRERLPETVRLLKRGFPWQEYLPLGQISLIFYWLKQRYRLGGLSFLLGVEETRFWVAVSSRSLDVVGVIGLYSESRDAGEAYWLDWFCVDPDTRRQGTGSKLLEFCIEESIRAGKRYLRVITSTDPNEKAAAALYERYGIRVVAEKQPWLWRCFAIRRVCRELEL